MPIALDGVIAIGVVFIYDQLAHLQPPLRVMKEDEHAVELVLGGQGAIRDGADWHSVGLGDLLWSGPGEATIGRSEAHDPYRCLALRLRTRPHWPRPVARCTRWDGPPAPAEFARQAVQWWLDARIERDLLCQHVVGALAFAAHRHQATTAAGLPAGLARVEALIAQDYRRDLAVGELAAAAGWSVQHLHAVCRRERGCGPHALLLARRLRAARELLAAGDAPLAEVAAASGFADATALCRAFRRAGGTSPGAWRALHRL